MYGEFFHIRGLSFYFCCCFVGTIGLGWLALYSLIAKLAETIYGEGGITLFHMVAHKNIENISAAQWGAYQYAAGIRSFFKNQKWPALDLNDTGHFKLNHFWLCFPCILYLY